MNPEDRFRELRDPARWVNVRAPKLPVRASRHTYGLERGRLSGAIATVVVLIIVVASYIGLTNLPHAPATPATPTPNASQSVTPSSSPTPSSSATPIAVTPYTGGIVPWNPALASPAQTITDAATVPVCSLADLVVAVRKTSQGSGDMGHNDISQGITIRNYGQTCALPKSQVSLDLGSTGPSAPLTPQSDSPNTIVTAGAGLTLVYQQRPTCAPALDGATDAAHTAEMTFRIGTTSQDLHARTPWDKSCVKPFFGVTSFERDYDGDAAPSPSGNPFKNVNATIETSDAAYSGGVFNYFVRLDFGDAGYQFTSCPTFTQSLVSSDVTVAQTATLNCRVVGRVAKDGSVKFALSMTAPKTSDPNGYVIDWSLNGGLTQATSAGPPLGIVQHRQGAPASAATCTVDMLRGAYVFGGAGMSHDYGDIVLTNTGAAACSLRGSASGSFVAYGDGTAVGAAAERESWPVTHAAPTVVLPANGGTAAVRTDIVNGEVYGGKLDCLGVIGDGFRIELPGVDGSLFVPFGQSPTLTCTNLKSGQLGLSQVVATRTTG